MNVMQTKGSYEPKYKKQKDSYLRFQKEWEELLFLIRKKNVGNVLGNI